MTEPRAAVPADLWKACDTLTNPTRVKLVRDSGASEWVNLPSLYDLLVEAIDKNTGDQGNGKMQSRPPAATDALSLLVEIAGRVRYACWNYHIKRTHDTPKDLRSVVSTVNTRNQADELEAVLTQLRSWVSQTKAICINNPDRSWRMHSAACRICKSLTAQVFGPDGTMTRQPALVVFSEGGVIDRIVCDVCGSILGAVDLAKLVAERTRTVGRLTA